MRDPLQHADHDLLPFDDAAAAATLAADAPCATERRDFLQRLLVAGSAMAGAGLLGGCATTAAASTSTPRPATAAPAAAGASEWDMSWTGKLGRYRTAYDSPEIQNGAALHFAVAAASGYQQALGTTEADFTPVLILRHTASVMVLDDAMWNRLALGERYELKDPTTGETALRNPFIRHRQGDKHSMVGAQAALDALVGRGFVVLTCNNALRGVAYMLRQKETALTPEAAMQEVRRSVLPGVYVMPNGIFAVSAAQDAGCHYMRVLV